MTNVTNKRSMKKIKEFKVKYIYHKPKTLQEKVEQERRLQAGYKLIFDKVFDSVNNESK